MCRETGTEEKFPERRLAELFKAELNVDMEPQALRMFVRHNWRLITAYAHAIHDPHYRGTTK